MFTSNLHTYTHLILALGIVREPTAWVFMIKTQSSQYPGIQWHDSIISRDVWCRTC